MGCKAWMAAVGACLLLGAGNTVAAPADEAKCSADDAIEVCVISAAISSSTFIMGDGIDVFVTLRITNRTDAPLNLALVGDQLSFMPDDAPSVTPSAMLQVSGMRLCNAQCRDPSSDEFTAFSPRRPLLVQIKYAGYASSNGRRMLQSATTASFTATLSEGEGHKQRFIPLPTPEFRFGNGLAK
jgi:hypothetical protein